MATYAHLSVGKESDYRQKGEKKKKVPMTMIDDDDDCGALSRVAQLSVREKDFPAFPSESGERGKCVAFQVALSGEM